MKLTPAHCRFDDAELAYLRARAAAEERSVPWVVRRLVREAMAKSIKAHIARNIAEEAMVDEDAHRFDNAVRFRGP